MSWIESSSRHFLARHEEVDADDARAVLELLEETRLRIGPAFRALPREVTVVLHPSRVELDVAQPLVPLMRRATAPEARRWIAGWTARGTLHMLAPRLLGERGPTVAGTRELLALTPAALYAQLVVAESNRALPPPWTPRSTLGAARWAWLVLGAGQWFSGQTAHTHPAIARRLRGESRPQFPPGIRDAVLLGGSVVDLIAREQGPNAAVRFVTTVVPTNPRAALLAAFDGRALVHTEGTWRAHLARMVER